MKPGIKSQDPGAEFLIDEGCHIIEVSNSSDDPDLSVARARVEPGVTTRWHRLHQTAERYYILQGRGRVEVGDLAQEVAPGDVVLIPPLCRQRISNPGPGELIFLALCTPRFRAANYEDIEAEVD